MSGEGLLPNDPAPPTVYVFFDDIPLEKMAGWTPLGFTEDQWREAMRPDLSEHLMTVLEIARDVLRALWGWPTWKRKK